MKIISINAGSSSLKFQMYEMPEENVLVSGVFEKIGLKDGFYTLKFNGEKIKKEVEMENHSKAVELLMNELIENKIVNSLEEIEGVGHRIVHGGSEYSKSVVLTKEVLDKVEELIPLAPLHNPANLTGINAFKEQLPNALSVGVFDTAFHQTMPEESFVYGTPYEWYEKYSVRRYGFHGISHDYITQKLKEITGKSNVNAITCHLGNGGSLAAIKEGICYNTSMGFGPNAGLVMGTRSGDIDSTIVQYIMNKENKTIDEVMNDLNKKSGFLGISGVSNDSRDIEEGIENGNERCALAQKLFVNRVVDYIAKYYVQLETVDAISFTGGIGENAIGTRKQIIDKLNCLGIKLDEKANDIRSEFTLISSKDSSVACYLIPTDEEVMIARDTYKFLNK